MGLEIRRVNMPPEPDEAPVRYVGVVNKVNDALAKDFSTRMTPSQIALFRAFMLAVCTDAGVAIQGLDSLTVLNLPLVAAAGDAGQGAGQATQGQTQAPPGTQAGPSSQAATATVGFRLSVSDRTALLAQLVDDGWLTGDEHSLYRLGPRAFLELGRMLLDVADDDVKAIWSTWL